MDLRRLVLVTDSIEPTELVEKGYLEVVVQKAIDCGFDPVAAIQMATLNVAEHFGLDSTIGGIAPGRCADILVLPDVKTIAPESGHQQRSYHLQERRIPDGRASKASVFRQFISHHQAGNPITSSDFDICTDGGSDGPVTVRIIEMVSDLVSRESHVEVFPVERKIPIDLGRDIVKVAAIDYSTKSRTFFHRAHQGVPHRKGRNSMQRRMGQSRTSSLPGPTKKIWQQQQKGSGNFREGLW